MTNQAKLERPSSLTQITNSTPVFQLVQVPYSAQGDGSDLPGRKHPYLATLMPVSAVAPTVVHAHMRPVTATSPSENPTSALHCGKRRRGPLPGQLEVARSVQDLLLVATQNSGVEMFKVGHFASLQSWTFPARTCLAAPPRYFVHYQTLGAQEAAEADRDSSANIPRIPLPDNPRAPGLVDHPAHWVYAVIQASEDSDPAWAGREVWVWDGSVDRRQSAALELPSATTESTTPKPLAYRVGQRYPVEAKKSNALAPEKVAKPASAAIAVQVPKAKAAEPSAASAPATADTSASLRPPAFAQRFVVQSDYTVQALHTTSSLHGHIALVYQNGLVDLLTADLGTTLATYRLAEDQPAASSTEIHVIWSAVVDLQDAETTLQCPWTQNTDTTALWQLVQTITHPGAQPTLALRFFLIGDADPTEADAKPVGPTITLIGERPIPSTPKSAEVAGSVLPLGVSLAQDGSLLHILDAAGVWSNYRLKFDEHLIGKLRAIPGNPVPLNHLSPWQQRARLLTTARDDPDRQSKPLQIYPACLDSRQVIALPGGYTAIIGEVPSTVPVQATPSDESPADALSISPKTYRTYSLTVWDTSYSTLHAETTFNINGASSHPLSGSANKPGHWKLPVELQAPTFQAIVLPNRQIVLTVSYATNISDLVPFQLPKYSAKAAARKAKAWQVDGLELTPRGAALSNCWVKWDTRVCVFSYQVPPSTLLVNMSLNEKALPYLASPTESPKPAAPSTAAVPATTPSATPKRARASAQGTPQSTKNPKENQGEVKTAPVNFNVRSGEEAVFDPRFNLSEVGISQISQHLSAAHLEDQRREDAQIRALLDDQTIQDAQTFTTTFLEYFAPSGYRGYYSGEGEKTDGATTIPPTCLPAGLSPPGTYYHLLAEGLTWAARQDMANICQEKFKGPVRSFPKHTTAFIKAQFGSDVTVAKPIRLMSAHLTLAVLSRCFGSALHPSFVQPIADCVQKRSVNPRPIRSAGFGPGSALNPPKLTKKEQAQRRGHSARLLPPGQMPQFPVVRSGPDFWPRAVIEFLLRAQVLSSAALDHQLVPYLIGRGEWYLLQLALHMVSDIPEDHIMLAIRSRLDQQVQEYAAKAKIEGRDVLAPTGRLTSSSVSEGAPSHLPSSSSSESSSASSFSRPALRSIALKDFTEVATRDTTFLAFLTAALSYRRHEGHNKRALRRYFRTSDLVTLAQLLLRCLQLRRQVETTVSTWYPSDHVIAGILPAESDLFQIMTDLLDVHMARFILTHELHWIVQGLRAYLKETHQFREAYQATIAPFASVIQRTHRAYVAKMGEGPTGALPLTTDCNRDALGFRYTFHLPDALLNLWEINDIPSKSQDASDVSGTNPPDAVRATLKRVLRLRRKYQLPKEGQSPVESATISDEDEQDEDGDSADDDGVVNNASDVRGAATEGNGAPLMNSLKPAINIKGQHLKPVGVTDPTQLPPLLKSLQKVHLAPSRRAPAVLAYFMRNFPAIAPQSDRAAEFRTFRAQTKMLPNITSAKSAARYQAKAVKGNNSDSRMDVDGDAENADGDDQLPTTLPEYWFFDPAALLGPDAPARSVASHVDPLHCILDLRYRYAHPITCQRYRYVINGRHFFTYCNDPTDPITRVIEEAVRNYPYDLPASVAARNPGNLQHPATKYYIILLKHLNNIQGNFAPMYRVTEAKNSMLQIDLIRW